MKKEKHIQSVLRSLNILKALSEADNGLGVNDAAEVAGISSPAAYCLLQTLLARGFAEKKSSRYCLGGEVVNLFHRFTETSQMKTVKKAMRELSVHYPSATLGYSIVRNNIIMTIFRISPEWPDIVQTPNNLHYDIYFNLTGIVFMSMLTSEDAFKLQQSYPFEKFGAAIWPDFETYLKSLEQVRRDGFIHKLYPTENTFRIAVPVWNGKSCLEGVLGVSLKFEQWKILQDSAEIQEIVNGIYLKLQNRI